MIKELNKRIFSWDKKDIQDISELYENYHTEHNFIDELILLLDSDESNMAAAWLLKHHFEIVGMQSIERATKIYKKVSTFKEWQSQLLLLQSMPYLPISDEVVVIVEVFIRKCLCDLNKFVRAWAYNGFYLLAIEYPQFRSESIEFFNLGLKDEPASIKVRIKKCLEKGYQ